MDPPVIGQKAAEQQTIELTCHVFGVPKPDVRWYKDMEPLIGHQYEVQKDGHLRIKVTWVHLRQSS